MKKRSRSLTLSRSSNALLEYAGASAVLPVLLPIAIGLYTGLTVGFDSHVVLYMIIGIVVTVIAIALGRMLVYRLEGGEARASP